MCPTPYFFLKPGGAALLSLCAVVAPPWPRQGVCIVSIPKVYSLCTFVAPCLRYVFVSVRSIDILVFCRPVLLCTAWSVPVLTHSVTVLQLAFFVVLATYALSMLWFSLPHVHLHCIDCSCARSRYQMVVALGKVRVRRGQR